ncbi:hypothetical protein CS0771_12070 [Catellatospora sp. IY07-71]|uniref:hypothetical protein n=1 Tax=Catellatospora sp. IY07-71 TaxID=2728827 RepID=UPI001BB433B8|nr:hypothetical protein [Catellatospora sp. IY07-71]BCJ71663.1 hypothetical protein CS0771_12070 [Catellatospora sp. IY07-71]
MRRKSFYDLHFGVLPGGARKDAHYIRGTLGEIRADLDTELAQGLNLYLLCWYGATLSLDVYQHGIRTESIDLHPYVTIAVEGYPDITFAGPGQPLGHDFTADDETDEGSLSERFLIGDLEDVTTVTVDWARITVPALLGEVARPDGFVTVRAAELGEVEGEADEQTLRDAGYIPYGFTDSES